MVTRRRGAAKDDGAFFEPSADSGDVAGVIAGRVFLFVGVFVFFINDDEVEAFERGEDSAAGSDDDACLFAVDLVPFVVAFALAEVAVEDGDFLLAAGEAAFEAFDGLRGEGNFRDEYDGAELLVEDFADET